MSNRRRLRHRTDKMTANTVELSTSRCEGCGEPFTIDVRLTATAVHDCETGDWYTMPRAVADTLNAMTDEEAAEWAERPIEEVRRVRRNRRDE